MHLFQGFAAYAEKRKKAKTTIKDTGHFITAACD